MRPTAPTARTLSRLASRAAAPDADLLACYRAGRDADAFAALVERHGPAVLGVCRRVCGDSHAADDAFQATFLTLARKAHSVRRPEALPGWLFATARRAALRARAKLARQRSAAPPDAAGTEPGPLERMSARELLDAVDAELTRLPAAHRSALLLCAFDGCSVEEAARRLGATVGSLRGWLQRGRDRLRKRLEARGLTLTAALAVGFLPRNEVRAALLDAATRFGVTRAATPAVAALMDGGVGASLKLAGVGVLFAGALAASLLVSVKAAPPVKPDSVAAPPVEATQPSPRLDHFGDPLPEGALARLGTMRLRHGAAVSAVRFTPDGRSLISAGNDGIIHVWDAGSGKERLRLEDRVEPNGFGLSAVTAIDLSADGKFLAATRMNQPPAVWDLVTGKRVGEYGDIFSRPSSFALSPGGKFLAFNERDGAHPHQRKQLFVVDVASSQTILGEEPGQVLFLPEDRGLIYRGDGEKPALVHYELPGGKVVRRFNGHDGGIYLAALADGGRELISCGKDGTLCRWDVATGRQRACFHVGTGVRTILMSRDGKSLFLHEGSLRCVDPDSGKDRWTSWVDPRYERYLTAHLLPTGEVLTTHGRGNVSVWDPATGKELRSFRPSPADIWHAAVSPDGRALAGAAHDNEGATIGVWDLTTLKPKGPDQAHKRSVIAVALSADGRLAATTGWDGGVRLWEAYTGRPVRVIDKPPVLLTALAFTPDGRTLLGSERVAGKVHFWDVASGKPLRNLEVRDKGPLRMALTGDGMKLLTVGLGSDHLRTWDTATGKLALAYGDDRHWVSSLAVPTRGETLVAVHPEGSARVWDMPTGKLRHVLKRSDKASSDAAAVSPDGSLLVWTDKPGQDATIRLTDTATGKDVRQIAMIFPGKVHPYHWSAPTVLAFAPDGKTFAAGWRWSALIRIWEVRTGKLRQELPGGDNPVEHLVYSPDGAVLLSAGPDGAPLVWDVRGGRSTALPRGDAGLEQLAAWWDALALEDAKAAYQAMTALRDHRASALPFIREKLPPVPKPNAAAVARLLPALGSDTFKVREQAARDLEKLGESIEPELRRLAKEGASPEARARAGQLLRRLDTSPLRRERAIEVLEMIGGPHAEQALQALAWGSPDAPLTRDARGALTRLRMSK